MVYGVRQAEQVHYSECLRRLPRLGEFGIEKCPKIEIAHKLSKFSVFECGLVDVVDTRKSLEKSQCRLFTHVRTYNSTIYIGVSRSSMSTSSMTCHDRIVYTHTETHTHLDDRKKPPALCMLC